MEVGGWIQVSLGKQNICKIVPKKYFRVSGGFQQKKFW